MLTDFRMAHNITRAERSSRSFALPPPTRQSAKEGIRYEKRVERELRRHLDLGRFTRLEHNPWFTFSDFYGTANCCPDFLLYSDTELTIVEVKLTWVDVAIHKLNDLYNPVISAAFCRPTFPLIVCRNLTRESPPAAMTLSDAFASPYRLLHWPDIGHIPW